MFSSLWLYKFLYEIHIIKSLWPNVMNVSGKYLKMFSLSASVIPYSVFDFWV
ncbi:hypothetical protein Hanom_Chr07g00646231 [Helianthus anomalus]